MAKWSNNRKRLLCYSLIFATLFLMNGCAQNQTTIEKRDDILSDEEPSDVYYSIGKGDILEITTWKEPDFSKEVQVRIDGKISFPLIGDVQAAGRSTEEVQKEIQEELKQYLTSPYTTVSVKVPVSQKIYIIGEIMKPGEYPLAKELTVLQAIALAGGFTEWASKKIIILRDKDENEKRMRLNYKDVIKNDPPYKDIDLEADDIIIVP